METFITSDTHAYHKNITKGVSEWESGTMRDFKDQYEMTSVMVDNINRMVGENDVIYHLGDWSFGGFDKVKEFRDRIVCKNIHLVFGNHDAHIRKNRDDCQKLFSSVHSDLLVRLCGKTFHMYHYPLSSWQDIGDGGINLYGHCHGNYKLNRGKQMDVGMDTNGLSPYHISEIIDRMDKIEIEKVDHHA